MSRLLPPGTTELLAPARDIECGRAAIDCGADAVYIGAERFGAREAAGNPLDTIAALAAYAHQYWARVYVTINTLLHDREFADAERLAWRLHEVGADALIVQDAGLLECDLPPLPLIASTQMHNDTPEKVAFLERVGFRRAILARELTLDEIRAVRHGAPHIELESFVHGALCVCYSGQCYLSLARGGRSGNRGQCAQPCRKRYTLVDARSHIVHERAHLLSLKDLNLSEHLADLLDAGVTSFKIEGRLKDVPYVANTVAHYRARLDAAINARGFCRSSSGVASPGFIPDPTKTFNRGYTDYFLRGRAKKIGRPETPKMLGEEVGRVIRVTKAGLAVATRLGLTPGDGLCFFDARGEVHGTRVNAVSGRTISVQTAKGIRPGTLLYRNHDHTFVAGVESARTTRRIPVTFTLRSASDGIVLVARDEDGIEAQHTRAYHCEPARDMVAAVATIRRQMARTGQSIYTCSSVAVETSAVPFLSLSVLNGLRREVLDALTAERERRRPCVTGGAIKNDAPYPDTTLTYLGNVLNQKAEAFYRRHGVTKIEPAAESGLDLRGREVMTTRYCVREQLDLCPRAGDTESPQEPLYLVDEEGRRLRLEFNCDHCAMKIVLE